MISAMSSGGGKTTLTCGLLAALKARGMELRAFKCGPDYIDPMYHRRVLGLPSGSLDPFLQGEGGLRRAFARGCAGGELALLEGAMGFYDGLGGTDRASAWEVARLLEVPVVLALRPRGASLTLAAQVRGMLDFRTPSRIGGVLLTQCSPALYAHLAPILEGETGLPVLGFLPPMEEASLPSRHLGLLTAGEIADLKARFAAIAARMEETVELDRLLALSGELPGVGGEVPSLPPARCAIAVARDEAFCFYYRENLDALRAAGAELLFFSPLADKALPAGADGLYLGGGYPELYGQRLGANAPMRESIRRAVAAGLPTVAECGGFLYLQQTLEDGQGTRHPMAGALPGAGFPTGGLRRFGYVELTAGGDSLLFRRGERVPAHEFHHWDSTQNGADLTAEKPLGGARWACGVATPTMHAGFPHLCFAGALPLAERFAEEAARWRNEHV